MFFILKAILEAFGYRGSQRYDTSLFFMFNSIRAKNVFYRNVQCWLKSKQKVHTEMQKVWYFDAFCNFFNRSNVTKISRSIFFPTKLFHFFKHFSQECFSKCVLDYILAVISILAFFDYLLKGHITVVYLTCEYILKIRNTSKHVLFFQGINSNAQE